MIKKIKLNMQEIESMLYFWQACKDREKVAEQYLNELATMPGISSCYDEEFDAESVRKVLSAITNRELLSNKTPKEGRFWNYNMWMLEDMSYTNLMIKPLKKLNIDSLNEKLSKKNTSLEELEVIVAPLHMDEYIISGNKLIINFFRVKPSEDGEVATVEDVEIKDYIEAKLCELIGVK